MTSENPMRFFVGSEGGATSLFATLLDMHCEDARKTSFRRKLAERLNRIGVAVDPETGPQAVWQEYHGFDIVVVWGEWILVIENKVAAASVTPKQLSRYYESAVKNLVQSSFTRIQPHRDWRVCIVYLTPTSGIGAAEFRKLILDPSRSDARIHLSWGEVISDARCAFPPAVPNEFLECLVRLGCDQVERIIAERTKTKTIASPENDALEQMMSELAETLRSRVGHRHAFKLTHWRCPGGKEIYGHIGGDQGNVYLWIDAAESAVLDREQIRLLSRFTFKITKKSTPQNKRRFRLLSDLEIATLMGPINVPFRRSEYACVHERTWTGRYEDLVSEHVELFCGMLEAFEPFMIG